MTRWHGITIGIGLLPLARPTAREAALVRAEPVGDLAVRRGLAVADLAQLAPHLLLEHRADRGEREVELLEVAGEVRRQLAGGLDEQRVLVVARRGAAAGRRPSRNGENSMAVTAPSLLDEAQLADG